MKTSSWNLTLIGLGLSILASFSTTAADVDYSLIKSIPVGGDGGWDYATVDSTVHRLYISHSTKVVVIDLDQNTVVGEISDTPGIHGIALAPKLGRAFTSNGKENKVGIVDLKTLQTLSKVDVGQNPDAIFFEPQREEVYAFNGRSKDATVIDAKSAKVVATIPLGGKPEFAQGDGGRLFVNLEDKNEVAVIDTAKHEVVARWPIAPGEAATGMAMDRTTHHLFITADKLMVVMDYTTCKVVGTLPIGDGADAASFDPATKLAFASCSDGTVTIAREESAGKLTMVQTLPTAVGSRTMTLDPATHKIYLAAADYEPATGGKGKPKVKADSFKVLVYGMDAVGSK